VGDLPLRTPRHRSLGGPLPRQPANVTHAHPLPPQLYLHPHARSQNYGVLIRISPGYPPVKGRLHTRYSPVRRSQTSITTPLTPRLACVKPPASVHPEPGSNSPLYRKFLKQNCLFLHPGPALANLSSLKKTQKSELPKSSSSYLLNIFNELVSLLFPSGSSPGITPQRKSVAKVILIL
jgi:hypothetical protein